MGTDVEYAILRTLSYFHVFHYPLSKDEIWKYLPVKCDSKEFDRAFADLLDMEIVFRLDDFYSLYKDYTLITRRKKGNYLSKKKLKKAMRISRFLGAFPFVEAVFISGSLSKDFALKDSDLDYFIVTAPNRLWTARNIMHLFRKLTFLLNAQNSFCMNYFISLQHPEIDPKNFYTALELSTLKTSFNHAGADELIIQNSYWVSKYFPNISLARNLINMKNKKWLPTRLFEYLVNTINGDKIESLFYNTTIKRWQKKWSKKNYDIEKCMDSIGSQFNTPLNYPVHLPEKILSTHEMIYHEAIQRFNEAFSNLPPGIHLHDSVHSL